MKKVFVLPLLLSINIASQASTASEWVLLPGMKKDFILAPAISANFGRAEINGIGSFVYGMELEFNCVLLQPPTNILRQHLSYNYYSDGDFSLQNIELNPHYMVLATKEILVGAGPGIGFVYLDAEDRKTTLAAFQLGGSVSYFGIDKVLLGISARYQLTTTRYYLRNNKRHDNANNWRLALNVGYRF